MSADGSQLSDTVAPDWFAKGLSEALAQDPKRPRSLVIRPLRDEVHVKQLPPNRKSEGGIELIQTQEYLGRVEVLAVGPDVYGFGAGDIVRVEGYKSGIAVSDGTRIISQKICVAVEESFER